MGIRCCHHCEDRWVTDTDRCDSACKRYAEEKAEDEKRKRYTKENSVVLSNHDINYNAYAHKNTRRKPPRK